MKIIKEGKIPSKSVKPVILKCSKCGTIFEVNEGEYSVTTPRYLYIGIPPDKYTTTCPFCNYHGVMQKLKDESLEV